MKDFIYKMIIAVVFLIILFEFTIGKRIDHITENVDKFTHKKGRMELVDKLRQEMRDGLKKEYILKEDDRILIYKFRNKLLSEINSVKKD